MTALAKALPYEAEPLRTPVLTRKATKLHLVTAAEAPVTAELPRYGILTNIALFFAAPFIGLFYIVALPFVGIALLTLAAARAALRVPAISTAALVLKHLCMVIAAPFIGLAFVVFFPVVCLLALAWNGGRAMAGTGVR
jgi:hypothetical protein